MKARGLIVLTILIIDVFLLTFIDKTKAIYLSIITAIIIFRLMSKNYIKELIAIGAFFGVIGAYHFFIQPPFNLPPLSDSVLVFIGTWGIFRGIYIFFTIFNIPLITPIIKPLLKIIQG